MADSSNLVESLPREPSPPPPTPSLEDGDIGWLYADTEPRPRTSNTASRESKPLANGLVVTQVVLLAVMLGVGFGLGRLSRQSTGPTSEDAASQPAVVTGRVMYATSGGTSFPDEGAVVMILPAKTRPAADEKIPYEGLRPTDLPPNARSTSMERLQVLGGAYTRTDAGGEFRVNLPRGGEYYVLIVSNHGVRKSQTIPNRTDLAQLGRYVSMASELLGDRRYHWRLETFSGTRRIDELLP